ncbi:hypothetical protein NSK_007426 [Nannochloropsis salina CCMP1776]|uniref:Uncharacterized protein n=1 Tax=Nannochloropsis salina CCMP1776 TaxID=1027361 RepID=A0A4D9CQ55_9STRA|nr:hypothetical protein NSK_007426 [Nannochloropsis salina CCMP1776]|eukprot:TFJ81250.1 hypothetical protein NSK_007426 [Nannochloropsis salina CCMP1776]
MGLRGWEQVKVFAERWGKRCWAPDQGEALFDQPAPGAFVPPLAATTEWLEGFRDRFPALKRFFCPGRTPREDEEEVGREGGREGGEEESGYYVVCTAKEAGPGAREVREEDGEEEGAEEGTVVQAVDLILGVSCPPDEEGGREGGREGAGREDAASTEQGDGGCRCLYGHVK